MLRTKRENEVKRERTELEKARKKNWRRNSERGKERVVRGIERGRKCEIEGEGEGESSVRPMQVFCLSKRGR